MQKSTLENSLVGRLGTLIDGIFKPMDFDWKLSISLVTGFMAKEVVVSTLGVLHSLNNQGENSILFKKSPQREREHALSDRLHCFCDVLYPLLCRHNHLWQGGGRG
ncbi:Ferrous iron transport protein B [Helicobacter bizzozeronii CCUG 35545]|nr:Ferrous iron transport protein B [Helicobacter bizzozeronii CCUG 35545]